MDLPKVAGADAAALGVTADTPSDGVRLPSTTVVAAYALVAALFASAMPLLAYAGSLALFGLPHVLTELRYVDGRFGSRLRSGEGLIVLAILGLVVVLRALSLARAIDPSDEYVAELGLVAVLAFLVVPDLASRPARAALAFLIGATIATGSAVAPWVTVVVLSILHNATPVGFLAERFAGTARGKSAIRTCAVLFVLVPIAIGVGLGSRALTALGLYAPDRAFESAGALASHLRVFVPAEWTSSPIAPHLFAASAYLQLLHYGVVIGVLPRLLGPRGTPADAPVAPWPKRTVLALCIAIVGIAAAIGFVHDFAGTRAAYSLVASVHAWIELPVLLWALAPRSRSREALA